MSRYTALQSTGSNVGTSSAPAASEFPGRAEIVIVNTHATQGLYVQLATTRGTAPTAVSGQGIYLSPNGGSWSSTVYKGPVAVIGTGAATTYTITEL